MGIGFRSLGLPFFGCTQCMCPILQCQSGMLMHLFHSRMVTTKALYPKWMHRLVAFAISCEPMRLRKTHWSGTRPTMVHTNTTKTILCQLENFDSARDQSSKAAFACLG